jgi:chromosome partitioning protein
VKIISVVNAKGGVAKTTTTSILGLILAQSGKRVLICDVDPQANATDTLLHNKIGTVTDGNTMYDVIEKFLRNKKENIINEIIQPVENIPNLFVAPASLEMEFLKDTIKSRSVEPLYLLNNIFKKLGPFDYLLMDCPADLSVFVENSIKIADLIIIPTIGDDYGTRALNMILPLIMEIKGDDFQDYKILYTLFNARATKIQAKIGGFVDSLEKDNKIFPFKIPVDQSIRNWQSDSIKNFMTDKSFDKSKSRQAYQELGNYILNSWS